MPPRRTHTFLIQTAVLLHRPEQVMPKVSRGLGIEGGSYIYLRRSPSAHARTGKAASPKTLAGTLAGSAGTGKATRDVRATRIHLSVAPFFCPFKTALAGDSAS